MEKTSSCEMLLICVNRTEMDSVDCFTALKKGQLDSYWMQEDGSVLPPISGMKNVLLSLD